MHRTTRRTVARALASLAVLSAVRSDPAVGLQPPDPEIETLILARLDELPPPPAFIRLVRITIEPGGSVPAHSHPGPEFALVEQGLVAASADGPVKVSRSAGGAETAPGGEVLLQVGDRIAYPASVAFSFANAGDEPASLLTLVVLPVGPDRPPGAVVLGTPAADGGAVRSVPLGDAVAPGWPATPIDLSVERIVMAAGASVPGATGPTLLSVERGRFGFALRGGEYEVSAGGAPPASRSGDGAIEVLGPGDAVFFPGGVNALPRAIGDGDLVLIRVVFATASAATASATPEPAATPETSTVVDARFAIGAGALVSDDGVRLRTGPSTTADVVAELAAGTTVTVAGLPVAADDAVWYPVTVEATEATGFVADAFLSPED